MNTMAPGWTQFDDQPAGMIYWQDQCRTARAQRDALVLALDELFAASHYNDDERLAKAQNAALAALKRVQS